MAFISKCITTEETDFLSRRNACCVRVSISRAKAMTFLAMCEDHGPDGRPWVEPIVFSAGLEGGKRNVWVRLRARLSADVSRANLLITVNLSVGDGGIESRSWAYQGWQHTSARLRTRSLNALSQREWACQGRGTALSPAHQQRPFLLRLRHPRSYLQHCRSIDPCSCHKNLHKVSRTLFGKVRRSPYDKHRDTTVVPMAT